MREYKKIIIIGVFVTVIILGALTIKSLIGNNKNIKSNQVVITENKTTIKKETTKERTYITVEIKGEVLYPGVYKFYREDVIVKDVIDMAGGLTKRADTSLVNCASLVSDHSSITISTMGSASYILEKDQKFEKININTCSLEDLTKIDGIGNAKAEKIISYRNKNGFFSSIEDLYLKEVITEALFEKIKDYITV